MGAGNVRTCYARWAHVPDPAFRMLVFMALVTMDDADPPVFWDGQESLSFGIGRRIPGLPAETDTSFRAEAARRQRDADLRAVKRCLQVLSRMGVVRVHRRHAPGRNAEYSLHLGADSGDGRGAFPGGSPEAAAESTRDAGRPGHGTPGVPNTGRGASRVVGGKGGETLDQYRNNRGTTSPKPGTSPGPVDNSGDEQSAYSQAAAILEKLPDLGADLLSRVPAGTLRERIITAAAIHLARNTEAS